jgi:hypothetical protein
MAPIAAIAIATAIATDKVLEFIISSYFTKINKANLP